MLDAFSAHDLPVTASETLSTPDPTARDVPIFGACLTTVCAVVRSPFFTPSLVNSLGTDLTSYGAALTTVLPALIGLDGSGINSKIISLTGSPSRCQLFIVLLI